MDDVQPLRPRSVAEWADIDPPPRRWVVPNLLPAGCVSLLTGDGGTGKTLLAIQLGLAATTGGMWLGREVAQGPVLSLFGEDEWPEIGRRARAIAISDEIDLTAAQRFHVIAKGDLTDTALGIGRDGTVCPTPTFGRLMDAVARIKPVLLIVDPLAEVAAVDENRRAEAAGFVRMMGRLADASGAAILLLGHPSLSGLANGTGASGSTGWGAAVRSRLFLSTDDRNPSLRRLKLGKSNYAKAGETVEAIYSAGRFVVYEAASPEGRMARAGIVDTLFLSLLDQRNKEGRHVSHSRSPTYAPAIFSKMPEADGATQADFDAAMGRLFKAGHIEIEVTGPPSRQRSRLIRKAPSNAGSNSIPTRSNALSTHSPTPPSSVGTAGRRWNADRPNDEELKTAVRMNGHGGSDARGPPS